MGHVNIHNDKSCCMVGCIIDRMYKFIFQPMQLKTWVRLKGRSGFTSYGTHERAKKKDYEGNKTLPAVIKKTIMTSVFVFMVCIRIIYSTHV